MRFFLVENNYDDFHKMYQSILQNELSNLNRFLDKYGFEVKIVYDYDLDDSLSECVGVFCSEMQDNASEFPVFINEKNIYKCLKEDKLETDVKEITYAIRGTLWHEAGHGIIDYLRYDVDFENEEQVAEDFAMYGGASDLIMALQEYIDES